LDVETLKHSFHDRKQLEKHFSAQTLVSLLAAECIREDSGHQ
jgi:hypothetical protein